MIAPMRRSLPLLLLLLSFGCIALGSSNSNSTASSGNSTRLHYPYEPVDDHVRVVTYNSTTGAYYDPITCRTLRSTSRLADRQPPFAIVSKDVILVTVDPDSGEFNTIDGTTIDEKKRRELDEKGQQIRQIPKDTRIAILTNNGTLVDVNSRDQQLSPSTLEIVSNTTDSVRPINTPSCAFSYESPSILPLSRGPLIILAVYNSSLDLYVDIATNDVVNSDGSEVDLKGRVTIEADPRTHIIPASSHSIVCTEDDGGNLVTSGGEYVDLHSNQLLTRSGDVYPIPADKRVVRATEGGTVVDARRPREQLHPTTLERLNADMVSVTYTPTPKMFNLRDDDDDQDDDDKVAHMLAKNHVQLKPDHARAKAHRATAKVRKQRIEQLNQSYRSAKSSKDGKSNNNSTQSSNSTESATSSDADNNPVGSESSSPSSSSSSSPWYSLSTQLIVGVALTVAIVAGVLCCMRRRASEQYEPLPQ